MQLPPELTTPTEIHDMTEKEMETKIKELEAQLVNLPRKKWNVIKNIIFGGIGVVIMFLVPARHGSIYENIGFKNTIIFGTLFYIFLIIYVIYNNNRKVEYEISCLEVDIETLKRKMKEQRHNGNSI